jgi:hypothetical protein
MYTLLSSLPYLTIVENNFLELQLIFIRLIYTIIVYFLTSNVGFCGIILKYIYNTEWRSFMEQLQRNLHSWKREYFCMW